MTIDRATLYEQVWTTPMSRLARTYGISDVGLAKVCEKHGIPRPPRGYWAKKRSGKSVRTRPLPPLSDPRLEKVTLYPCPGGEVERQPTEADRLVAAERARGQPIVVVPELPDDPHHLVGRTLTSLRAAKPDEKGLVRPRAKKCLDVVVGHGSIDRAMRIMDALITALEARSYRVVVDDGEVTRTIVQVGGESIAIRMDERLSRQERPRDERKTQRPEWYFRPKVEYDYFPSGELALHICHSVPHVFRHSWRDGGRKRVEDWLNAFVVGLIRVSQGMKVERVEAESRRVEAERRRREWEEAERRRQELERQRKEEAERVRQLELSLDAWSRSRDLKAMIAEARSRAVAMGRCISPETRLGQWHALAEWRAQALDPIAPLLADLPPAVEDVPGGTVGSAA